jgi:hypothetical protein
LAFLFRYRCQGVPPGLLSVRQLGSVCQYYRCTRVGVDTGEFGGLPSKRIEEGDSVPGALLLVRSKLAAHLLRRVVHALQGNDSPTLENLRGLAACNDVSVFPSQRKRWVATICSSELDVYLRTTTMVN